MTDKTHAVPPAQPASVFSFAARLLLFLLLGLSHLSCDGKKDPVGSGRAVGTIAVDLELPDGGRAARGAAKAHKSALTQGRFRVSGEGMVPIDTTVQAQDNRLIGRLDGIPVGQRTVELFLLDAQGTQLWQASTSVQVAANAQATATLVLERSGDQAPEGSIRLASSSAQVDSVFGVTAEVSDLHDADESLEVRWDFFYDGEFDESGEWLRTRAAENTYSVSGQVTVALQVRDRSGNVSTYTAAVEVVRAAAPVVFADAGLEAAVRQAAGRESGDIFSTDVESLTELVASERNITDLAGLERLVSLTILDLSANQVSDLTPLAGLDRLVVLDLSENQISDLGPLSGLERLIDLQLSVNRVADLSPLAGLAQLIDLDLSGNRISDLSPLAGLGRLAELDLDSNEISDVEPLLALERLETVDLQFNPPFKAEVYAEQIPALITKGVRVDFNALPLAAAGPDQEVEAGKTVQLDGGGSADPEGDELSYAWTQVSGPDVALSDASAARPTFDAQAAGTYVFSLVVSDGPAESAPDTVSVLVPNRAPLADAGADQGVEVGATVQLDGGGSSDPDGADLTYAWTQVVGASVALDDPTAARPSFVAAAAGTYTFTLVVNDGDLSSAVDAVTVTAAVGNLAPIADAGTDVQVQFGDAVQLDGSGSNDPEGTGLTFRWTAPDGISLSASTAARPSFDADVPVELAFVLRVNDGETDSAPDTVVITVSQNSLPVVSIVSPGTGSSFLQGDLIVLAGAASDAEDGALAGDALQWNSDIDGALGAGNEIRVATLSPGDHTVTLGAFDSQLDIGVASVSFTVTAVPRVSPDLTVSLPGGATMDMVLLGPGSFVMGSPDTEEGHFDNEAPPHGVELSREFYLGQFELTQGQWQSVMGTAPWEGQDFVQSDPNRPAVYISWDDLQDFIGRLNESEGEELYRLPTEAEWEFVARAGTAGRWSFGDDESQLADHAWYADNVLGLGLQVAQPVGTRLPNPWGLYDMHGNVFEWLQDWVGPYGSATLVDPSGPETPDFGDLRLIRGGAFGFGAGESRSANRGWAEQAEPQLEKMGISLPGNT